VKKCKNCERYMGANFCGEHRRTTSSIGLCDDYLKLKSNPPINQGNKTESCEVIGNIHDGGVTE
jgi:hypothetical protein